MGLRPSAVGYGSPLVNTGLLFGASATKRAITTYFRRAFTYSTKGKPYVRAYFLACLLA